MPVFKRGNNESSQKLKNILITQHHVNQTGSFLKRWSEKLHQLVLFFITRFFQFVQACHVGPTPAYNLLQTQQNHNLALIIMFITTKYCKIISSFMLFCKILSGAPFPCVVKMLKCFYYLKSSSSFLTFFNFHIICILEHIIICLVSCHMLVPIFAWWKKIQYFICREVMYEL